MLLHAYLVQLEKNCACLASVTFFSNAPTQLWCSTNEPPWNSWLGNQGFMSICSSVQIVENGNDVKQYLQGPQALVLVETMELLLAGILCFSLPPVMLPDSYGKWVLIPAEMQSGFTVSVYLGSFHQSAAPFEQSLTTLHGGFYHPYGICNDSCIPIIHKWKWLQTLRVQSCLCCIIWEVEKLPKYYLFSLIELKPWPFWYWSDDIDASKNRTRSSHNIISNKIS